jgi:nucleoside-diphosphate-sugar epimerase
VARALIDEGREVVVLDVQPFPSQQNNVLGDVVGKYELVLGNVADLAYVLNIVKRYRVEGIIHLAAIVAGAANEHPVEALQVNIIGSANMLEVARILDIRRVVLTSSSNVYGPVDDIFTPRREEEMILPASGMYAVTKLTTEQLTYTYRELYGVDAVALRPHNIYGPGEAGQQRRRPIYEMVSAALAGKSFRQEYGGDTVFELTYVKDYAKGVIQAYDCPKLPYYVYNLGYGRNKTMFEVADVLSSLFPCLAIELGPGIWPGALVKGEQKDLTHRVTQRAPHDNTRARRDFGYNPEWPIERAIPDWIKWLREGKDC